MTSNIKVPLGKKDGLLRYWWENAIEHDLNISKAVVAALEYYMLTGDFIDLASVDITTKTYDNAVVKWVYISEESPVYGWLECRQKKGEKLSTVIKYVLRNSLKSGPVLRLSDNDFLYWNLEKERGSHQYIRKAEKIEIQKSVIPAEKPAEEVRIINEIVVPETKNTDNTIETAEPAFNIFDQLVGNKGLSFDD